MADKETHPSEILAKDIDRFYQDIESLLNTIPIVMAVIGLLRRSSHDEFAEYLKQHASEKEIIEDIIRYEVSIEHINMSKSLKDKRDNFKNAYKLIPRHYIISLVSQFDSLLGSIIRFIYSVKPEILNTSQKTFSYTDITQFSDIASFREYVIEKEIESVLRKSHSEQFEWFKQRLGTPFNKDLDCWSSFIELTERRNLFVHTDGKVTSHYLDVCREHDYKLDPDLKAGDQLEVSSEYFEHAFQCICEVGIKMAHVIWRCLDSETIKRADEHLIECTFDLINKGMYALAINILDHFTKNGIRHSSEGTRRIMIVNKAQSYKWSGDNERCLEIIEEVDWTACEDKFKLATAALREDYKSCYNLMRRLKSDPGFHKVFYQNWPIFKRLREQAEFLIVYQECYDEPFALEQSTEKKLEISFQDISHDRGKAQ